jgi:hypothetical protein
MPLIRIKRLSAVLSPFRIDLDDPSTLSTSVPFAIFAPSSTNRVASQPQISKIILASESPLTIVFFPSFLQIIVPLEVVPSGISKLLVMSPVPISSFRKPTRAALFSISDLNG